MSKISINVKITKIYFFLISIILVILLDFIYQFSISPLFNHSIKSFGYYGYPMGTFSLFKFYIVSFISFMLLFLLPDKIKTPSSLIIIFYYFFSTIPFLSLYTLNLTDNSVFFIELISIIIFYIMVWPSHYFYNKVFCNNLILKNVSFYAGIIFLITFIISFILFFKFVIHTKVDSVLDVYSQRNIFNKSGFVMNYILSFLSFGILSFLFFLYLIRKKWRYILYAFLITFIVFLSSGSKLIFGNTFLILFLVIAYKNYCINSYRIGFYLLIIIILTIIIYISFNNAILVSLFVRRTFILPAQIFDLYFSFFTSHNFNYLSEYTHMFISTSYDVSASHIIGSSFFLPTTHANSGIISDSYANFGILGTIIFGIMLCLILIFSNFLNSKFGNKLTPLFAGIAISLTNSGLLGVFIYQIFPIIFIFFIFYLISTKRKN